MAGDFTADLSPEEGASGVYNAIAKADSTRNGKLYIIEVPGKENLGGLHKYDGQERPW